MASVPTPEMAVKGVEVGDTVRVEHETRGATCGMTFDKGEEWLLYVVGDQYGLCSPGGPVDDVAGELQNLRDAFDQSPP